MNISLQDFLATLYIIENFTFNLCPKKNYIFIIAGFVSQQVIKIFSKMFNTWFSNCFFLFFVNESDLPDLVFDV